MSVVVAVTGIASSASARGFSAVYARLVPDWEGPNKKAVVVQISDSPDPCGRWNRLGDDAIGPGDDATWVDNLELVRDAGDSVAGWYICAWDDDPIVMRGMRLARYCSDPNQCDVDESSDTTCYAEVSIVGRKNVPSPKLHIKLRGFGVKRDLDIAWCEAMQDLTPG